MAVRTIDKDKCIGCGTCVESCPMDVFRLDTLAVEIEEYSPCRLACPLGVNQREYHNLIKLDMLDEAAEKLGQYHPMPAVTGRICPHPCEVECTRKDIDEAVNINGLEQYLGDRLLDMGPESSWGDAGQKVAVIGSGPAGLSAAYFLTIAGYRVTVFEKDQKPGGLLRNAIPNFRLPADVLDRQIAFYEKMGIKFKTGVKVGKDVTTESLQQQGFKACIAATGAAKPFGLPVEGVDAAGITSAMQYLGDIRAGKITKQAGKVAVIGGGSVALDAARSAIRLGANEVSIICLEVLEQGLKDSMLALPDEIEGAIEEGVVIHPSRSVVSFEKKDGYVSSIKCVECTSVRDEDGKFNPQYGYCTMMELPVDTVILAIGQGADPECVPDKFNTNPRGYIIADALTKQVESNLFAAGDAVSGPSTVVKALAAGKRAALTVDRFIKGEDMTTGLEDTPKRFEVKPYEMIYRADRINRETVSAEEAKTNFQETARPLGWYNAHMESRRCLTCGSRSSIAYVADCQVCSLCVNYCPTDAIEVVPGPIPNILHAWDVINLGK